MKFDNKLFNEYFYTEEGVLYNKVDRHKNKRNTPILNTPNSDGYLQLEFKGRTLKVHRVIYYLENGWMPVEVDHINGNTLDNRPENLRAASHQENSYNSRTKKGASEIKGVSKCGNKWRARICVGGKRLSLGLYTCLELAELVVSEARDKYHGEFGLQY